MVSEEMLNEFKADLKQTWEDNSDFIVSRGTRNLIDEVLTENFEQGSAHSFQVFDLLVRTYKEGKLIEYSTEKPEGFLRA